MNILKKRLSNQQEFEILKLVLDKFLWLGFIFMAFGLYHMYETGLQTGLMWIITGAVVLLLLSVIIVKEFEIIK